MDKKSCLISYELMLSAGDDDEEKKLQNCIKMSRWAPLPTSMWCCVIVETVPS